MNGQESMLGAGHVRRETGGGAHHQPGPACGELLVMEASGLLPGVVIKRQLSQLLVYIPILQQNFKWHFLLYIYF